MKLEKNIKSIAKETVVLSIILIFAICLRSSKVDEPKTDGIISAQYQPTSPTEQEPQPRLTMAESQEQAEEVMAYVDETWASYHVAPALPPVIFYDVPLSTELQEYAYYLCHEMSVHYPLAIAVMQKESGFDSERVSQVNKNGTTDHGIMQITSSNHDWLEQEIGITDWLDPEQNILAGVFILSIHTHYQDHHQILMAYNSGAGGAKDNFWDYGIYTNSYSEQVMEIMEGLERLEQDGTA